MAALLNEAGDASKCPLTTDGLGDELSFMMAKSQVQVNGEKVI